jgi:1,4-alpha-glucan branching enzyme
MKQISLLLSVVLFLKVSTGFSQVITVTPPLPNDQSSVEVIFDASLGSGGLKGYNGDVYAHTGVITNLSTGTSDWKYVKAGWGVNIPDCKLTSLGNNKWKLVIGPSIRAYYNVPATEEIQNMAFVFRSGVKVGDVWLEGKTASNGDIFYDVSPSSLNVKITNPDQQLIFTALNQPFDITVSSLLADNTSLYAGGQLLTSTTGSELNYTLTPTATGRVLVKAVATKGTEMVADSFYYYVRGAVSVAPLPQGITEGINYLDDHSAILCLYAPLKQYVFALGDFNNWLPDEAYYMNRTPDGQRYWIQINNLEAGKEYIYQYLVDGSIYIGDPYADKVSDPWNDSYISNSTYPNLIPYPVGKAQGVATVLQTAKQPYAWTTTSFDPPAVSDMMIFELLIRDFTDKHTFQSVIDSLDYFKKLGINTIELMPVNEFEGNLSWGYNTSFYFAVDKYYGPANDLKRLVDICHQKGIAVVMDMVLNHAFGTSPYVMLYWDKADNRPTAESPFYNPIAKHDYNVGYDMNHESPDTKYYVSRVLRYWLNEFHVDGYRFDLSKGFTQKNTLGNTAAWGNYDASRIAILSAYHDTITKANPKAVLILEHFADNNEEKELSTKNMMLWGNMNYNYGEAAKGNNGSGNLSWGVYTQRGWTNSNLVTYMESHDEEREMYRCITSGVVSGSYSIKDTATALKRESLAATFFLTIPGPKMIWQFGEMGYDYSINYPSGTSNSRLDQKPPRWDYLSQPNRDELFKDYAALLKLRENNPLFRTTNFTLDVVGAVKKIKLTYDNKSAVVLGNFDVVSQNVNPEFYHTGTWYDYLSGDSLVVTNVNDPIAFKPGEYRLYLSEKVKNPYGILVKKGEPFSVVVGPNPARDMCNIFINIQGSANCEIKEYSMLGSESGTVYSGPIDSSLQVPWTPAGKGIHILRIRVGNQQVVRKVIVQ